MSSLKTFIGCCICLWIINLSVCKAEENSGKFKDSRDGKTYSWVKIGGKIWMAENLAYKPDDSQYRAGKNSGCPGAGLFQGAATGTTLDDCGYFYDWVVAMDLVKGHWPAKDLSKSAVDAGLVKEKHRGISPEGWHIPTKAEVEALIKALGGGAKAAKALCATSDWSSPGNNSSGFNAKPTGTMEVP